MASGATDRTGRRSPADAGSREAAAYALATLAALVGAVVVVRGAPGATAGMCAAWLVQVLALRSLLRALHAGRPARRAWIAGIVARAGGLAIAGAGTAGGVWGTDVPVAYGVAMLVLLLTEAGWLAVRGPGRRAGGDGGNRIERTHSSG